MDGLRLSKTVGSVEHKYVWQGSKLVSEYFGGKELEFFYDESGTPYAFSYKTSANAIPSYYYYVTNLQGDVVSILDANGNEKASYSYNAWGKILSATGDMASVNPLRYRGYYYDDDTGFYYLKGRYYDPQIQRFLNADGLASTGQSIIGTNMFAYCGNNPVIRKDADGYAWETIWDAISLATSAAEVVANPYDPWAWIGLVGDAADVLIPFVGGIGETTRALKAASQVAEMIDTASDAKKGWKIGEDITSLTRAGNVPSWSTLRSRYWKNKAYYFASEYTKENVSRMKRGLAPQLDGKAGVFTMELHHMLGRKGNNYYLFFEISPKDHARIDPFRFVK